MAFARGQDVVLRLVGHDNGWVVGWPCTAVEDGAAYVGLYTPARAGVTNYRFNAHDERSQLMPESRREWPAIFLPKEGRLRLAPIEAAHSVDVRIAAEDGRFLGWKVNLQTPLVRTAIGFDTTDNTLDVMVEPNRSWRWKDAGDVARRVEVGLTFEHEARSFREEGERVIAQIEAGAWPFTDEWTAWRPDPAWLVPTLPEGWETLPGYDIDWNRA